MTQLEKSKFSLGRVVATPGALSALETAQESALGYLQRHEFGDWGEVCREDQKENEFSLKGCVATNNRAADELANSGKLLIYVDRPNSLSTNWICLLTS